MRNTETTGVAEPPLVRAAAAARPAGRPIERSASARAMPRNYLASGPGRFQKTAWYNLFDYPQKSGDTGYLRTLLAYLTVFYPLHGCIFTYSIRVR